MPVEIYMAKHGDRLVPETAYDAEQLDKVSSAKPIKCRITQPRSDDQQRLYWKILGLTAANTDNWPNAEALHFYLRVKLGYVKEIRVNMNEVFLVPKSTAYGAMDQADFNEYVTRAFDLISTDILPGVTVSELMGERAA